MFIDREFIEDSDSSQSFEGEEEPQEDSQNPASFQSEDQDQDPDFGPPQAYKSPVTQPSYPPYEPPLPRVQTPPRTAYDEAPVRPLRKAENEKVNILQLDEGPKPTTASARPGSSSATMRALMLEKQRSQYNSKRESFQVSATGNSSRAFVPDSAAYEPGREYRSRNPAFAMPIYEPGKGYGREKELAPVKAEKTVFGLEEIEEVRLDESKAVKHEVSKVVKSLQIQEEAPPESEVKPVVFEEEVPIPQDKKQESEAQPYEKDLYALPEEDEPEPKPPLIEEVPKPETKTSLVVEETKQPPVEVAEPQQQIAPVRRPVVNIQQVLTAAMQNMPAFLDSPLPKDVMIQCTILRERSGFNRIYPKYFLFVSDTHQFLLAGRKRPGNKTSNYLISMSEKDLKTKSPSYLGKVRSNFMGTEFMIYDKGINPKKKAATLETMREELGVIMYQSNLLGAKGPRKMRVLLPAVNAAGDRCTWKPTTVSSTQKEGSMLNKYKDGDMMGMFDFFNKPPKWNERIR